MVNLLSGVYPSFRLPLFRRTSHARAPIAALRQSHDHLARLAAGIDAAAARGPSYASEWNIGQVASHLGSGAAISLTWLEAALAHAEPMDRRRIRADLARPDAPDGVDGVRAVLPGI
jgi:hypothetical protein